MRYVLFYDNQDNAAEQSMQPVPCSDHVCFMFPRFGASRLAELGPLSQGTAASQFDVPLLVLVLLDSLLPSSRLSLGIRREGHAGWQLGL